MLLLVEIKLQLTLNSVIMMQEIHLLQEMDAQLLVRNSQDGLAQKMELGYQLVLQQSVEIKLLSIRSNVTTMMVQVVHLLQETDAQLLVRNSQDGLVLKMVWDSLFVLLLVVIKLL